MAKDPFAIPDPQKELQRDMMKGLPPELRKQMKASYGGQGAENRRRPRITIDELNTRGVDAIKEKWPDLQGGKVLAENNPDNRGAIEKVFDFIDIPRNLVANAIGFLAGVDKGKLDTGSLGLKRVMMSDVLEKLGVQNQVARAIVGFAGDIIIDPLTYVGGIGIKVAKNVPNVLRSGMSTITAGMRSGRMPSIVTNVLGDAWKGMTKPLEIVSAIAKEVNNPELGTAARAFFHEFGVHARPALRIPFTDIGIGALPGRQARAYKAMTVGEEGVKALKDMAYWKDFAGSAKAVAAKTAAEKAIADRDIVGLKGAMGDARSHLADLKRQFRVLATAVHSQGQRATRAPIPSGAVRSLQRKIDMAEGLLGWMRDKSRMFETGVAETGAGTPILADKKFAGSMRRALSKSPWPTTINTVTPPSSATTSLPIQSSARGTNWSRAVSHTEDTGPSLLQMDEAGRVAVPSEQQARQLSQHLSVAEGATTRPPRPGAEKVATDLAHEFGMATLVIEKPGTTAEMYVARQYPRVMVFEIGRDANPSAYEHKLVEHIHHELTHAARTIDPDKYAQLAKIVQQHPYGSSMVDSAVRSLIRDNPSWYSKLSHDDLFGEGLAELSRMSTLPDHGGLPPDLAQAISAVMRPARPADSIATTVAKSTTARPITVNLASPLQVRPADMFPRRGDIGSKVDEITGLRRDMRAQRTYRVLPPELQAKMGEIGRGGVDASGVRAALGAARDRSRQGYEALKYQAGEIEGAFVKYVEAATKRPDVYRLAEEVKMGKAYDPIMHPVKYALNRLFGQPYGTTNLRSKELALMTRGTLGAKAMADKAGALIAKDVDDLARLMTMQGMAKSDGESAQLIGMVLDLGNEAKVNELMATDAGRAFWQRMGSQIAALPGFKVIQGKVDEVFRAHLEALRAAGIKISETQGGLFHRMLDPEAAKWAKRNAWFSGQVSGVGGAAGAPSLKARNRAYEIAGEVLDPQTGAMIPKTDIMYAAPGEAEKMLPKGFKLTGVDHPVSAFHENEMFQSGKYSNLFGSDMPRDKIKNMFDMDPVRSIQNRTFQQERMLAAADMQKLTNQYGIVVGTMDKKTLAEAGYRAATPLSPSNPLSSIMGEASPFGSAGKEYAYLAPVADMLDRYANAFVNDKTVEQMMKLTDMSLAWGKRWMLFHPGYVIRNMWQNTFGALMAGGPKIALKQVLLGTSKPAQKILKAIGEGNIASLGNEVMTVAGKKWRLQDLAKAFYELNGAGADRTTADLASSFMRGSGPGRTAYRKVTQSALSMADLVRTGNQRIESSARLGTWLAFMDEGLDGSEAMSRTVLAMPDMSNITQFERGTMARIAPWYRWMRCVPQSHRALTRNGWKEWPEIKVGEDILTYNMAEDKAEWQPVQAINTYQHKGHLLKMAKETSEFLFTPEHKWAVWGWRKDDKGRESQDKRKLVMGYQLCTKHRIPKSAPHDFTGADESISPREAAILGWLMGDGHMRVRQQGNNHYPNATIFQSKPKHFAQIRELLGGDARSEYVDSRNQEEPTLYRVNRRKTNDNVHFNMSSSLSRRMHEICPSKDDLPGVVSRLTKLAAEAMFKALMDAEGSSHPRAGTKFTQNNGPVLMAFQMLALLLNKTADTPGRAEVRDPDSKASYAYIGRARRFFEVGQSLKPQWYDGVVWCPTTANSTWFMENDGRVIITGNSNGGVQLFHYLPQNPSWMAGVGKFKNFLEGASAAWRTDSQNVPDELRPEWQREQQAPQITGDRSQGESFLLRNWFPFEEATNAMAAVVSPGTAARGFISQTRPGIKFLAEAATGRDIFRQAPLKTPDTVEAIKAIPQALMGSSGTAMDNLLSIRPLKEYGRRVWEQPTTGGKIMRATIGGAAQPLDAQQGLKAMDIKTNEQMGELRRLIVRAKENGDAVEEKRLLQLFMLIQAERQRLGLLVSKSTQQTFSQQGMTQQPSYPWIKQVR